ncbi:hypothetical protein [Pseudomonas sp. WC2]
MTDSPVTDSRRMRHGPPFCFYIEGWPKPKIGRFAMARRQS